MVAQLPVLELTREPVAGRIIGRRVRTHAVGVRLNQERALAVACVLQRLARHGEAGKHIVPSTRTPGNPKPCARRNNGMRD